MPRPMTSRSICWTSQHEAMLRFAAVRTLRSMGRRRDDVAVDELVNHAWLRVARFYEPADVRRNMTSCFRCMHDYVVAFRQRASPYWRKRITKLRINRIGDNFERVFDTMYVMKSLEVD
jgi:hypothetical protein